MESTTDLRQLMAMAVRMRDEGRTSDPRYHQIVTILRAQQQRLTDARQAPASEAKGKAKAVVAAPRTEPKPLIFTEKQLTHLHQQIRTFKALSRTMDELLAKDVSAAAAATAVVPEVPAPVLVTPPPTPTIASAITLPEIIDITRPTPLDVTLAWARGDREIVYVPQEALASCILHELDENDDTPTLPTGLRGLQAQLREQMVMAYHVQLAQLGDPVHVDRTFFKRKRPMLALYDPSERERRMKSLSNEKKRRAARNVYLRTVLNHAREFSAFHKARVSSLAKVSRGAKAYVDAKANRAEREEDRQEKLRLKALKANDMAAYSKLVAEAKNERLTYLLSQTNTYLDSIRELVRGHREKHGLVAPTPTGDDAADVDDELDYLGIAVNSEMPRQPQMLVGGDLKEYQLRGLQWMVSLYDNRLNGILADEMGLGKTIQSISLVTYIMEIKHNHGPFLVVVPLSTLSNWVNEFRKWAPDITLVVYKGHPQARKDIYRLEMASVQFNVLLTTYEYIMKDKHVLRKYDWQYIIVDEGHRMKNAQSKFAMTLGSLYTSRNRLLLTGTPLQNSLPELWALLNFLLPTIFESVDNFEQWFSKPFSHFTGTGENNELSDEERMLIINRLHQVLRPFLLRRVKSSVLDQLPDKVERVIRCELSGWQKIMYRRIQEGGSLLMEASSSTEKAKSSFTAKGLSNILMQLRKVCNHPYLFQTQGYPIDFDIVRSAGKFELLDRMLPKLHAAGHRVLMFSQMTQLMHVLEDYFTYRGFRYLRLDGSTSADEREQRMFMFNAPDSPYFIFLLSTRAGGLGLNLATADTVIIFDSDWNPAMDAQAQDRAHRIGQKNEVRVFRLVTNSPIEEKILSRATEKMNMNNLVVEAGKFHAKSKEADRRAMLESLIKMESEDAGDDEAMVMDNDELNSIMALTDEELAQYHRMDNERILREAKTFGSPFNRLMGMADVPPWLKAAEAAEVQKSMDVADDDGVGLLFDDVKRKRKEISYRDMSEAQFHRILEDGGDAVDADNIMQPAAKKPKIEAADAPLLVSSDKLRQLYDAVLRAKDGSGRLRHFLFLEKPSAEDYPDYYTIVTTPMDLVTIDARIASGAYASFDAIEADFRLMFENAQRYNHKDSLVHHDAVEMAKVMKTKLRSLKGLSGSSSSKKSKKARR